ncbi:uncharacterized protein LOC127096017 [Lathyrus oleraceus]|uniref:Uncharacterized protein n=1 Tax=Pisum sativum TaxID=3888 RepID=A0A9D5BGE2_PEA|nr:uncharacterized protein LOC127096017 [Pisum sativum]KAI5443091.1 hypothetical protein KIW84_011937 [Pisum sativum]
MMESQYDIRFSDKARVEIVALSSMVLCFLLIIFPALKVSSFGSNFMGFIVDGVPLISCLLVITFQIVIFVIIANHPVNKTIFPILYILLLLTATSVIQISFISFMSAIFILFTWILTIAIILCINSQEINDADIASFNGFRIFLTIISVISLLWNANSIFHLCYP